MEKCIIIGAGPAGLSAAYELLKESDIKPIIIEELDAVGGIARTVFHNGNGIDIGGHRLFSKNKTILNIWEELLPLQGTPAVDYKILNKDIEVSKNGPNPDIVDNVMLKRKRVSRIYYNKKFFDYPISLNLRTIINLGIIKTIKTAFSYIKSSLIKRKENNLEDFMINRFGKILYELFFKDYTKKVWGLYPNQISKEWGEQRIKGLSLSKAIINAIITPFHLISNKQKEISLIDEFFYPKYGCGQLWNLMAERIISMGGEIRYNEKVIAFDNDKDGINSITIRKFSGEKEVIPVDYVISSMPIKDLVFGLKNVPQDVIDVASNLFYRDYILVGFYLDKFNLNNKTKIKTINNICPDNWIYLQEKEVTAGRLQIMNNWSPYLVRDFENKFFISFEYFANEGDSLWSKSDEEILKIAVNDMKILDVADEDNILDKTIIKVKKAYPAYFGAYSKFDIVKNYLKSLNNLFCIGRNGQHKYNNMDHSMLSGIEAVKCIKTNANKDFLWNINSEVEYLEK